MVTVGKLGVAGGDGSLGPLPGRVHPSILVSAPQPLSPTLCFLTLLRAKQLSSAGPVPHVVLPHLGPEQWSQPPMH